MTEDTRNEPVGETKAFLGVYRGAKALFDVCPCVCCLFAVVLSIFSVRAVVGLVGVRRTGTTNDMTGGASCNGVEVSSRAECVV